METASGQGRDQGRSIGIRVVDETGDDVVMYLCPETNDAGIRRWVKTGRFKAHCFIFVHPRLSPCLIRAKFLIAGQSLAFGSTRHNHDIHHNHSDICYSFSYAWNSRILGREPRGEGSGGLPGAAAWTLHADFTYREGRGVGARIAAGASRFRRRHCPANVYPGSDTGSATNVASVKPPSPIPRRQTAQTGTVPDRPPASRPSPVPPSTVRRPARCQTRARKTRS